MALREIKGVVDRVSWENVSPPPKIKEKKMIKYICNVCGREVKDNKAETLVIYKGLGCKEYKLCPTCSEEIRKELEKGVSHENNMVRHP